MLLYLSMKLPSLEIVVTTGGSVLILALIGCGIWQTVTYQRPKVDRIPVANDPRLKSNIKGLPLNDGFILVFLGCGGCTSTKLPSYIYHQNYEGVPIVFAVDDKRSLPGGVQTVDAVSVRIALNAWFQPRVYGFRPNGQLAYIQKKEIDGTPLLACLSEAKRAVVK